MPSKSRTPKFGSKEYYEIEKLKAELKQINKPFYKRIPFWNWIIALGSLLILYKNGVFDFQTKALELKRENLQYDINQFTTEKNEIRNQINIYQSELTKLKKDQNELLAQNNRLEVAYKISNSSLSKKNSYLASLLDENKTLKEEIDQKNNTDKRTYTWDELTAKLTVENSNTILNSLSFPFATNGNYTLENIGTNYLQVGSKSTGIQLDDTSFSWSEYLNKARPVGTLPYIETINRNLSGYPIKDSTGVFFIKEN